MVLVTLFVGFFVGYVFATQQLNSFWVSLDSTQKELAEMRSSLVDLEVKVAELSSRLKVLNVSQPKPPTANVTRLQLGLETPVKIYERVKDSVVSIHAISPFGEAQGSGFVYDTDGHIITNQHVINGAVQIRVKFADGSSYPARLVGEDKYSDLAVIRIEKEGLELKPLTLGDSSTLRVGTPIMAIGNPFGLAGSLTTGVVSQIGRSLPTVGGYTIPNVIQIDAAINPGNSGGPLLNYDGEVVGITTAIESTTGTFSGVGFAIPSNTVKREVPYLIKTGSYDHPWLGVRGIDLRPEIVEAMGLNTTKGWLIVDVVQNGPAHKAGLRGGNKPLRIGLDVVMIGGDVIVKIDERLVVDGDDVSSYLEENKRPGEKVSITVIRDGAKQVVEVVLGTRPPP